MWVRATRDLKLLCGAVFLSSAGDMLALITLALLVHDLTGSGIIVSALFAATMIPAVLLAPVSGRVADRIESVRLIRWASLGSFALALALAFTEMVPVIIGLTACMAAVSTLSQPAEFALVPAVSAKDSLTESNGLIESVRYAGMAIGPLVAGVLVAGAGTRVALIANAASFVAITVAACFIRSRRHPAPTVPATNAAEAERETGGFTHLWQDRALRTVVLGCTASLLFLSGFMTIEVFFLKDVLGAGDAVYALTTSVWMLGMVLGSTVLAARIPVRSFAVAALAGLALQGAGIFAPAVVAVVPALILGCAVGGIGHGVKNTMTRTLLHTTVAEEFHGRAFATFSGMRNAAEVTALAGGGVLVTAAGPRAALLVAGLVPVLIALVALLSLRAATENTGDMVEIVPGAVTVD